MRIDLEELARTIRRFPGDVLSLLDDAGSIRIDGSYYLVKVDGYALSRSLYPWCSPEDWGFRAVASAVSDVIVKGCRPLAYAISVGLPPQWGYDELRKIVAGINEAVELFGGYIANFDTNYGFDGWIDVFVLAHCRVVPVPRSAEHGNVLILSRPVGFGGACLLAYSRRIDVPESVKVYGCRPRINARVVEVIEKHREAIVGSIDVSDTLYEALMQLTQPSGLEPFITANPSTILVGEYAELCRELGISLELCALSSCEEYAVLLAVREPYVNDVLNALRDAGEDPIELGYVVSKGLASWCGKPMPRIAWSHRSGALSMDTNTY